MPTDTATMSDAPNPSPEWTPEERLQVIAWLVGRPLDDKRQLRYPGVMYDVCDCVRVVSTASAVMLEANRHQVLDPTARRA